MKKTVLALSAISTFVLAACEMPTRATQEELQEYRETNCTLQTGGFEIGQFVLISVANLKGQIVNLPKYLYSSMRKTELSQLACRLHYDHNVIQVRVNTHGIAVEGGNWNTARPEVLPILDFKPFELKPWEE